MIISAASDYRAAAQRILPPFLFHYLDGGAYAEHTLRRNVEDLSDVALAPAHSEKYVGTES
ncbi:L-lactate dehydrogenase [cytochrome] [Pantoea agglomerans]|uniref:L-lactate dehydrogenase [cytochrome] n=1 Tax=Enterobacter agglomerans TaxID=549 RepID=A0A379AKW1_ENTAG|nr:L-lactate dehydrogenase [cytochrome] [Pantoea agglomerans]